MYSRDNRKFSSLTIHSFINREVLVYDDKNFNVHLFSLQRFNIKLYVTFLDAVEYPFV